MNKSTRTFIIALAFLLLFAIFTILVKVVDVQAIGPNNSEIGFATLNKAVFDALGTNEFWLDFSDRLGYTAFLVCAGFGCIGAYQLFSNWSIKKVDNKIVLLGLFYIAVIIFYFISTKIAINYRPVLEADGTLEPSYPSSHMVLALSVFSTMFMQKIFNTKENKRERTENFIAATVLVSLMVVSRLLSGIHWFTDIIGSLLITTFFILCYVGACHYVNEYKEKMDRKKAKVSE